MRTFECRDCGHTWQLPFGEGGQCDELNCPACDGKDIVRLQSERVGWRHRRAYGKSRRSTAQPEWTGADRGQVTKA